MKIFNGKISLHKKTDPRLQKTILISAILSILVFIFYSNLQHSQNELPQSTRFRAAQVMHISIQAISDYCRKNDIVINAMVDPNQTGLIGQEYTSLTTTLGQLEAKRTSTNPEIAALIVDLLKKAGLSKGDKIAIGCSGSFPALMIAALAAAKAIKAEVVLILSFGSSSFGANRVNFTILDIYNVLYNMGIFTKKPNAISLGGANDTGDEFEPSLREKLIKRVKESGIPFIFESDLQKNVATRMDIYKSINPGKPIKAFINAGGNLANMGSSDLILNLSPGLNTQMQFPDESEQGVIQKMAAKNIPVIHLLHLKELVINAGAMWDPIPLPDLQKSAFLNKNDQNTTGLFAVSIVYFVLLMALVFYYKYKHQR